MLQYWSNLWLVALMQTWMDTKIDQCCGKGENGSQLITIYTRTHWWEENLCRGGGHRRGTAPDTPLGPAVPGRRQLWRHPADCQFDLGGEVGNYSSSAEVCSLGRSVVEFHPFQPTSCASLLRSSICSSEGLNWIANLPSLWNAVCFMLSFLALEQESEHRARMDA